MNLSSVLLILLPLVAVVSADNTEIPHSRVRRGVQSLRSGSGRKGSSKGSSSSSVKGSSKSTVLPKGPNKGSGNMGSAKGSIKGSTKGSSKAPKNGRMMPTMPTMPAMPTMPTMPTMPPAMMPNTISDFVFSRPDLEALQLALARAGFVEALTSNGPFTLFAPNNDAFNTVPGFFLELLFVNDEFIPHLQNLLLFHLLFGEASSVELENLAGATGTNLAALSLEMVVIQTNNLTINGVDLIEKDNDVENGIVHIIDEVLAPSWVFNSITGRVAGDSDTSILFTLLGLAGIDLTIPSALTLVAPTNDAFNALPDGAIDFLTNPDNADELIIILAYHVINGVFVLTELQDGLQLPTVLGTTSVVVSIVDETVFFNQAQNLELDILANNGVVLKISAVLNPANSPTRR